VRSSTGPPLAGDNGVSSVSIDRCFHCADMQRQSGSVLVTTDNDKAEADPLATAIGQKFISMRAHTAPDYLSVEDAGETPIRVRRPI